MPAHTDTARADQPHVDVVAAVHEAVSAAVESERLLRDVDHLLLACSGGGDSTVLLDVMYRLLGDRMRLTVVHCDHRARPDAADDVALARDLAAARDLSCMVVDTILPGGYTGSSEAGWRQLRRRAFVEVAAAVGAQGVATGHTADDQAETVLMNLARGSGLRGVGGMRPRSRFDGIALIRPLLGLRRESLRQYAQVEGLAWRDDPSNEDISFARNRVRRRVVPELERVSPGAVDNIARSAGILRGVEDYLKEAVTAEIARLARDEPLVGGVAVDVALFELPAPIAAAVVLRLLADVKGDLVGVGKDHVDAILRLAQPGAGRAVDVPGARIRLETPVLRVLPLADRRLAAPTRPETR